MDGALTDRLPRLRDALTKGLVERDVAVRLALLAALAGEHLLLVGPPGTAKSLIARRLRHAFRDATYFERLLTRFSVPEELFGPLSIKGLEEDRYERLTKSYLPTASIAFLDEIFKANSAILNALLTLLNEREFDNGTRRQDTPLVAVVGASNELPEGEELDALFDRFLLRLRVDPVSKDAFPDLLKTRGDAAPIVPDDLRLTENDLDAARKEAEDIPVPDDVTGLLCDLREWCSAEEMPVSDRRWRKIVKLLQTSAWTCGRDAVSIWDCWLLQHCLWSKAEGREKIYEWYASRVGATTEGPSRLVRLVHAWEGTLKKNKEDRSQKRSERGLLYLRSDGKVTIYKKERDQYGREINLPLAMEPRKHEPVYIRHCLQEVKKLRAGMEAHKDRINKRNKTLEKDIHEHLWVMDSFTEPASQGLAKARDNIDKLLERLEEVRKGYDQLPRKEEEPDLIGEGQS